MTRYSSVGMWLAVCLGGSVLLSAGCTPGAIGFLNVLMSPNVRPDWIDFTKDKKEPKVVFLVCSGNARIEGNTELFNADQLLAQRLNQVLSKIYKENSEKVHLISPAKIQEYKAKHPDWKFNPEEVGKFFKADFLVTIEITNLTMHESSQLFRGKSELQIRILDLNDSEAPVVDKCYKCTFPEHGPIPADDSSSEMFRDQFIYRMCSDLSRRFASYPFDSRHDFDSGRFDD